jgi:hypothetical protein
MMNRRLRLLVFVFWEVLPVVTTCQSLPTPDFLPPQYVFDKRITSVVIVDSLSAVVSAFRYRTTYLEFAYNGKLIKSAENYDSLTIYNEKTYYYYTEKDALRRKEKRDNKDNVLERHLYTYNAANRLIRTDFTVFEWNGQKKTDSTLYDWQGDTLQIELNRDSAFMEFRQFDTLGREIGMKGNYKIIYDAKNRIAERIGLVKNDATKILYRKIYHYTPDGKLEMIEKLGKEKEVFVYDSKGLLHAILLTDSKTGKIKAKKTFIYQFR